jgi:hypothetical protein
MHGLMLKYLVASSDKTYITEPANILHCICTHSVIVASLWVMSW